MIEISKLLFAPMLLLSVSCGATPKGMPSANDDRPSQVAARAEIKSRWEQSCKTLDKKQLGKEYPGKKLDLLIRLLEQAPPAQLNAERERVRGESTDYEHMEEYDRYLLQSLFLISANAKDRAGLVYLLSAKCPRFIANSAIELEVASLEIPQPLLILFDSYDKASDGEQRYLVDILRHAFKDLSGRYPDHGEFMRASKVWYLENYSKMKVNPYYHPFADFAEQRDLFVGKD